MTLPIPASLLICLTLAALSLFQGACGSDASDALSASEYFEQVDGLDDALEKDLADLGAESDALEEEDREAQVSVLRRSNEVIQRFVQGLGALTPPVELEETHRAATDGAREFGAAFSGAVDRLDDADLSMSQEELSAFLFAGVNFETLFDKYNAACLDIESAATAEGISIELDCD